jgi:predicted component of type VI protein secretion system
MALELQIQERGGPTRTQVLPKEVAFFGRREDNDVVLPYTFVSSRHGRVFRRDGSVFVEDMGSTNGILVNGEAVTPMVPRPLQPDDSIEIEKIVIQARWIEEFDDTDAPATYHEETRPVASTFAAPSPAPAPTPVPAAVSAPVAAAPVAPAPAAAAPAASAARIPRAEAPATMWELQANPAAVRPASAPDPSSETARYAPPPDLGGGTVRLTQAPLSDVLASGRVHQRQAEEADSFALWELFFKGLGLVTIVAGLVLLVVVLLA